MEETCSLMATAEQQDYSQDRLRWNPQFLVALVQINEEKFENRTRVATHMYVYMYMRHYAVIRHELSCIYMYLTSISEDILASQLASDILMNLTMLEWSPCRVCTFSFWIFPFPCLTARRWLCQGYAVTYWYSRPPGMKVNNNNLNLKQSTLLIDIINENK